MKRFGYVRVAAATPHLAIADPKKNAREIIKLALDTQADVIAFPELCVTGYTCGDLFLQRALMDATEAALHEICEATHNMTGRLLFVGAPILCGGRLFNCAVAMAGGKILGAVPKSFLPSYGEFYETRWFAPACEAMSDHVSVAGQNVPFGTDLLFCDEAAELFVGAEICEDLWVSIPPSSHLVQGGANVIVNLSASNESLTKDAYRRQIVSTQSARCIAGYVYASAGMDESSSDLVFSGHNLIYDNGTLLQESMYRFGTVTGLIDLERIAHDRARMGTFRQGAQSRPLRRIAYHGTDRTYLPETVDAYPFVPREADERARRCAQVIRLQAAGLATRLQKTGMKSAVVGISGGLDSTLALIVTAEAFELCGLDKKNICAITMPGFGTTDRTFQSARELIETFGASMRIIPIAQACMQHFADIGHDPKVHDVTYENAQARERTQILMDVANEMGGLVVGTGDLSELALGWCTYNGDHMSMYAVNAGVPKTLIQYVVSSYAKTHPQCARVLQAVLDTPISPELLPPDENGQIAQKTEESIGKYDIHDFILYHVLRNGSAPDKIYALLCIAFADVPRDTLLLTMRTFYRRFFTQQFKRNCVPDGVKVGAVGLSPRGDWRMPSEASSNVWLRMVEHLEA